MDSLLDLTLRNPLISFRRDGKRVLPLATNDIAALEDALASGGEFVLAGEGSGAARGRRRGSTLATLLTSDATQSRAVELDREARKGADEGGAWNLFMALGTIAWREANDSVRVIESPILLVPVALSIDRAKREARLTRHDDETIANPSIIERMRRDFDIRLDALKDLPEDDAGIDVPRVLEIVRAAISRHTGWEVREEAFVSRFAFDKIVMWKDLRDHGDALLSTGIAARIADPDAPLPSSAVQERSLDPSVLDDQVPASSLPLVLDADSTQIAAIELARRGGTFVLEGPPGTGKSQTITNIIAAILESGRRVLFVSEKMAALRVVHHRLTTVGLDAACLELHSHASAKSAALRRGVLESLDSGWIAIENAPGLEAVREWASHGREIDERRRRLNRYVREIHTQLPLGLSFRDALARRVKWRRRHSEIPIQIPPTLVQSISSDEMRVVETEIEKFCFAFERVSPVDRHPLVGCAIDAGDNRLIETVLDENTQLRNAWVSWQATWDDLRRSLGPDVDGDGDGLPQRLRWLAEAASICSPVDLRNSALWSSFCMEVSACARAHDGATEQHRALMVRWNEQVYAHLDLAPVTRRWASAFVLFAWFALWTARRVLAPAVRTALPGRAQIADDLELAARQRDTLSAATDSRNGLLARYAPRVTDLAELRRVIDRVEALRGACAADEAFARLIDDVLASAATSEVRVQIQQLTDRGCTALDEITRATDTLEAALRVPVTARRHAAGSRWLANVPERLVQWQNLDGHVRDWGAYQSTTRGLVGRGLRMLVHAAEERRLTSAQAIEVFRDALAVGIASLTQTRVPLLSSFDGQQHSQQISAFRDLDRSAASRARAAILATLKSRAPRRGQASSSASELGVLERELRKKTRHMPVRKLLKELPTLLPRLKPCLLMSPLSVAQYLPPHAGLFDVVVFDEASQITVPDAIGAIARARQVIVVGDTKQMPPSAFFRRQNDDTGAPEGDDTTQTDLESILDEMAVVGVQRLQLQWHYRSRHESLIAFSNAKYYGSRLKTFPSAALPSEDLGIERSYLSDARYDGAGENKAEARALVQALVSRLRATEPGRRSFGIVTFGIAQQTLIADLLDEVRANDEIVEAHFCDALEEPLFVKNLENVQGDERDEIYFSTTYGPDERGVTRQNFGPITMSGGARRLNVAVTRARRKLHVFTSLRSTDVKTGGEKSDGVRDLEAFLRFVERGGVPDAVGESVDDQFDSEFEREVYDELKALGWEVHTQVGVGGYRIDLGVLDPASSDRYILGVECDGAAYHSGATARDRDRLRQEVLEGLGWRLFRIWSTDWWSRKPLVVQQLRAALEHARSARIAAPQDVLAPIQPTSRAERVSTPTVSDTPPSEWLIGTHRVRRLLFQPTFEPRAAIFAESFFDPSMQNVFVEGLVATLEAHGPLLTDELARLVMEASGARRLTDKWTHRLGDILQHAHGRVRTSGEFVWPLTFRNDCHSWVRTAAEGDARRMSSLPVDEIATAALVVLSTQGAMPVNDLPREVAVFFGNLRPRADAVEVASTGVRLAIQRGIIVSKGDRVFPAPTIARSL